MLALPIPDKRSPVRYRDVVWRGRNLGELVAGLTKGKQRADYRAHLDPDLREGVVPRERGWRPTLGQHGIAQGHLRKRGVGAGDVFLFWGLFRAIDHDLRWVGRPEHHLWGFLQVESVVAVDTGVREAGPSWQWASQHPHLAFPPDPSNTLYVGAERLSLPGRRGRGMRGYGTFDFTSSSRRLTAAGGKSPLDWSLPGDFLPKGRLPLSHHDDLGRWSGDARGAGLRAASRGQEFVLDLDLYPKVAEWLAAVILEHRATEPGESDAPRVEGAGA